MSVKGRPDEWTSWTSKAIHGVRQHHAAPFIVDCVDFALAVQRWWESLRSTCNESDWIAIQKPGPHGLVALLMCLLWWGRAARQSVEIGLSEGDPDPLAMWHSLVLEVGSALKSMLGVTGTSRLLKRPTKGKGSQREAKRYDICDVQIIRF